MNLETAAKSPHARVGLWLPLATVAAFGALAVLDVVALGTTVMTSTLATALAWVAVGFGGDRVIGSAADRFSEPDRTASDRDDRGGAPTDGRPLTTGTGLLVYFSVTTALGWLALLAVVP